MNHSMTTTPNVLTLEETADYLRLPKETIEQQAARGQIPGRRIEDTWRFLKAAIDDWLRSQDSRTILLQQVGALATDETLPKLRAAIYAQRGRSESTSLAALMDELSDKAEERGLTDEKLEGLLRAH